VAVKVLASPTVSVPVFVNGPGLEALGAVRLLPWRTRTWPLAAFERRLSSPSSAAPVLELSTCAPDPFRASVAALVTTSAFGSARVPVRL